MTAVKPRLVVLPAGLRADQPDPASVAEGALYFVTDEGVVERNNGSAWTAYSGLGGSGISGLTSPRVPYATGTGVLGDDADLTFVAAENALAVPRVLLTGGSVPTTPAAGTGVIFAASLGGHTAPSYIDEAGFVVRMTRDLTLLIRNDSGSTIARGKAVRVVGSTGVVIKIDLADADVFDSGRPRSAVGLTLESIGTGAFGAILLSGLISNLDTSALTEGAVVYLSTTAGALTATAPSSAGSFVQPLGVCTRSHASQGSIELDLEVPATALLANLTVGRVPYVGTGPVLVDDAEFVYDGTLNQLRVPTIVGGTGTTDDLHLKATTGVGTTASKIFFDVGNNGNISAVEIQPDAGGNFGQMGVGTSGNYTVDCPLAVFGTGADIGYLIKARAANGAPSAYLQVDTGANAAANAGFSFNQRQNGVEWQMHVVGTQDDSLIFNVILSSGAINRKLLWLSKQGNVILNDDLREPATGTHCLVIGLGTLPATMDADTVAIYAKDDGAGVAQLYAMNESNVAYQLTGMAPTAGFTATRVPFGAASGGGLTEDADLTFDTSTDVLSAGAGVIMSSALPGIRWVETDESADVKRWRLVESGGALYLQAVNDAESVATGGLAVGRSGIVTSDGQPSTYVTKSGAQTLTTGVQAALAFDSEVYDVNSCHDNSTNNSRLTVPTGGGGTYLVTATVTFTANNAGLRGVSIRLNGAASAGGTVVNTVVGDVTTLQATAIAQLTAAQYVELMAVQTSGGNLDVTVAGTSFAWIKLW